MPATCAKKVSSRRTVSITQPCLSLNSGTEIGIRELDKMSHPGMVARHHLPICIQSAVLVQLFPCLSKGWNRGEDCEWIIQLPVIRSLWSGRAMVATFFVNSGYVLSYKSPNQVYTSSDQVFHTINSTIV